MAAGPSNEPDSSHVSWKQAVGTKSERFCASEDTDTEHAWNIFSPWELELVIVPQKRSTLGFWRVTPVRSLSEAPLWSCRLIDLFCPLLGNEDLDGCIHSLRIIATFSLLGLEGKITPIFCYLEVCHHIYHKKMVH